MVSPRLAPALVGATDSLALLAANLDAVAFRDVWRAVAVAANRLLYNDVATEASFSPQVPCFHAWPDTFSDCPSIEDRLSHQRSPIPSQTCARGLLWQPQQRTDCQGHAATAQFCELEPVT